ncbi:MAG: tetratricopeptide repeat protein [Acidobacteriota bacterium]
MVPEVGPYRIDAVLGKGGMGVVYRAVHRASGEIVALKTVIGAAPGTIGGLRREIRALARMRHPGIVRIIDEGIADDVPWYAMELVRGRSLRAWLGAHAPPPRSDEAASDAMGLTRTLTGDRDWWTLSPGQPLQSTQPISIARAPAAVETLREILTLAHGICSPIAYLHGEGIVHKDLKPENVLVRESGIPVIVDFGLTARSGAGSRDVLEAAGEIAGTLPYMAPEQARGEIVDARADLYAFGCILYELCSGCPPFVAKTPGDLLRMHAEEHPVPLSRRIDGIPPQLDDLISRLLAKNPRDRIGYADVAAAALEDLGARPCAPAQGAPPRPYLYRAPFAGRRATLTRFDGWIRDAASGTGGPAVMLLRGESGSGKTRLLTELSMRAAWRGFTVVAADCSPSDRPLAAFRSGLEEIADRCRETDGTEPGRALRIAAQPLSRYEPAIAAGGAPRSEGLGLLPDVARARVFRALARTFALYAAPRRPLVMIDDLQWADELTIGFLAHVTREPSGLLAVGSFRSEDVPSALAALRGDPRVSETSLPRLGGADVAAIARDMLAADRVPAAFVRFLATKSEGNPFFACEYLRAGVAAGIFRRDRRGAWQLPDADETYGRLPFPAGIRELLTERLAVLDGDSRSLLEQASVIGRDLSPALLMDVSGLDDASIRDPVSQLVARQLLQEAPAGFAFCHDRIRELTYDQIPIERRRGLHGLAARAIDTLPDHERSRHLAALGVHWESAGHPDRALAPYLAAAREAAADYAFDVAEQLYRSYLRLATIATPESVRARNELGDRILRLRGKPAPAEDQHRTALTEARACGARVEEAQSLGRLAAVHFDTGKLDSARQECEESLAILDEEADGAERARVVSLLGGIHMKQGRMTEARESYEAALRILERLGDRWAEGGVRGNLGLVHCFQGRLAEAEGALRDALSIDGELGNRRDEGVASGNLGLVLRVQGRLAEAREAYGNARAIHREMGDRGAEADVLVNHADVLEGIGEPEAAQAMLEAALELARAVGRRPTEAAILGNLGNLALKQARMDEGSVLYQTAIAAHRELGASHDEASVLANYARFELVRTGSAPAARELLDRSEQLLSEGDVALRARVACLRGHVALAEGKPAHAEIQRTRSLLAAAPTLRQGDAGSILTLLESAQAAAEAGRSVLRGYAAVDLPPPLLAWLIAPPAAAPGASSRSGS